MQLQTTRFGAIDVPDEQIIRFDRGILGFEDIESYAWIDSENEGLFQFLQAVDEPDLTFVVTNPLWFRPDYQVEVYQDDLVGLQSEKEDEIAVLTIVTVPSDPENMTVNLLAPLLVNTRSGMAKQVVQKESSYQTRHKLLEELARAERMTKDQSDYQDYVKVPLRTVG